MKKNPRLRNRYRNYLSIEAMVIILVIACFHFIPDKKWASVITSFLFIGSTGGILFCEWRSPGHCRRPSFWGALLFLFVSAIPIFVIRLIIWELPFDQIELLGVRGPQMHQFSNYVFMIMMVCFFADSYLETVKAREAAMKAENTDEQ